MPIQAHLGDHLLQGVAGMVHGHHFIAYLFLRAERPEVHHLSARSMCSTHCYGPDHGVAHACARRSTCWPCVLMILMTSPFFMFAALPLPAGMSTRSSVVAGAVGASRVAALRMASLPAAEKVRSHLQQAPAAAWIGHTSAKEQPRRHTPWPGRARAWRWVFGADASARAGLLLPRRPVAGKVTIQMVQLLCSTEALVAADQVKDMHHHFCCRGVGQPYGVHIPLVMENRTIRTCRSGRQCLAGRNTGCRGFDQHFVRWLHEARGVSGVCERVVDLEKRHKNANSFVDVGATATYKCDANGRGCGRDVSQGARLPCSSFTRPQT